MPQEPGRCRGPDGRATSGHSTLSARGQDPGDAVRDRRAPQLFDAHGRAAGSWTPGQSTAQGGTRGATARVNRKFTGGPLSYLRLTLTEFLAISDLYQALELGKVNLATFGCLLSFELTDARPELARRIDALTDGELRVLRERMPGHPGPGFTEAEVRTVAGACGTLPRTGRFVRPLRRRVVKCLLMTRPTLARKVARLSHDGFEGLCERVLGLPEGDA